MSESTQPQPRPPAAFELMQLVDRQVITIEEARRFLGLPPEITADPDPDDMSPADLRQEVRRLRHALRDTWKR